MDLIQSNHLIFHVWHVFFQVDLAMKVRNPCITVTPMLQSVNIGDPCCTSMSLQSIILRGIYVIWLLHGTQIFHTFCMEHQIFHTVFVIVVRGEKILELPSPPNRFSVWHCATTTHCRMSGRRKSVSHSHTKWRDVFRLNLTFTGQLPMFLQLHTVTCCTKGVSSTCLKFTKRDCLQLFDNENAIHYFFLSGLPTPFLSQFKDERFFTAL